MDHQPRGYMRPPPQAQPPPPGSDPYQRPPPPPPPNQLWPYSAAQFQYQHQTQHSSPPLQWPSHPPPQPLPPYPVHHPISYNPHHLPYSARPHYPQPHQLPPRPPPHGPRSYVQDSGGAIWSNPQYANAAKSNEEDWAAKAREWAAAKAATNNQLPPPQYPLPGKNEDQNNFHGQYPQPHDSQHLEMHKPMHSTSNYQQYPFVSGPPAETSQDQFQGSQICSSTVSTFTGDVHAPFRGRSLASDSASSPKEEKSSTIQFVHRQEVPSSYTSLAGTTGVVEEEKINESSSTPVSSHRHHHIQSNGRPGWVEEGLQVFSSGPDSAAEPSNQPLNVAPKFSYSRDPHVISNHIHSSGGTVNVTDPSLSIASNFAWPPSSAPRHAYAPIPSLIPSGSQGDLAAMPPPPSVPSAPIFPSGPGFQPTVPMLGAAFGVTSALLPLPTSFSGDAYGSERPKKASVPNWLREEIIKSKAGLSSSAPDISKVNSRSIEEDSDDTNYRNRDQADTKSIDSIKSVEDDDDEVEMEAARTTAINQEIKRILTEVLSKVTDELYDEIASKVLEDDPSSEACQDIESSKHQPSASSTPKASAKVLFQAKNKDTSFEDVHEKSSSSSPGDVLGLASYASDEEDSESQIILNQPESSSTNLLENRSVSENGGFTELKVERSDLVELEAGGTGQKARISAKTSFTSTDSVEVHRSAPGGEPCSSGRLSGIGIDESQNASDFLKYGSYEGQRDDSQLRSNLTTSDENEVMKNMTKKEQKDFESREVFVKKGEVGHSRHDRKHGNCESVNNNNSTREEGREKGRTHEIVTNKGSRRAHSPYTDDRIDIRSKKRSSRDDKGENWRDRELEEKNEHSTHRSGSDTSRHEQHRSPRVGSRGRDNKVNSRMRHTHDSSEESSGYSERKLYHSRRHKSPSPSRPRTRKVSPSAHSKHSKRRHSPYSSLETTRRKRSPSRSKSPVQRRRH